MKYFHHIKRPAFTMIEIIFVIIVIGILTSLALPRFERDSRQNAADNILSAIRYTQQLALLDNKTSTNANWQKTLWAIRFVGTKNAYYTIATDDNKNGAIAKEEATVDPTNGKYLFNTSGVFSNMAADESPNIFIGHNYGINSINFSGGCSNLQKHIAFDHLGRPFNGIGTATWKYSKIMHSDCIINFGFDDSDIPDLNITIEKQTGYAYIVGQHNS